MTPERMRAIEDWRSKGVTLAAAVRVTRHLDTVDVAFTTLPLTRGLANEDLVLSGASL